MPPAVRPPTPAESAAALFQLQQLSVRRRPHVMTEAEIESLGDEQTCMHCGGFHARACPRVRSIEWHANGNLARVEYWPSGEVDWTGVMFDDVSSANGDQVQSVHEQPHPRPPANAARGPRGGRPGRPGFT